MKDAFEELLEQGRRPRRQSAGWTAWVERRWLALETDDKPRRPWCRGRDVGTARTAWFPRTSKRPREGEIGSVMVPAQALPRLGEDGWFLASAYITKPSAFEPPGDPCGVVSPRVLDELHDKLHGFYWTPRGSR